MKLLVEFKLNGWAQYTIEDFAKIQTKRIKLTVSELQEKDG